MIFSLSKKTILLIVCIAVVISVLAVAIYSKGISDVIRTQYEGRSIDIVSALAVYIDPETLTNVRDAVCEIYDRAENKVKSDQWGTPEFEEYIAQYSSIEEMEDFKKLVADLRKMQDVLDVDCLYTMWVDVPNECYVYLADASYEEACPPGCIDPVFFDNAAEELKDLANAFRPNITNTPEYGWICATAKPVFDSEGEIIAMACVDISMNDIMTIQRTFLIYVVAAFLILTLVVCIVAIIVVNRVIVKPVNKLSNAASQYKHNKKVFSELNVKRRDEIGTLTKSMVQMEEDIDGYINNLEQTTKDLLTAREHAEQMDRAANIDALTKVRNKRAYDIYIGNLNGSNRPYGIVMIDLNGLKMINDTYGHEKGDVSINNLCRIICRVFKHSPVYRVGGDEFVVILENDDYEERDQLIQSIRDIFLKNIKDDSSQPWECVTAAVGCAVFDPETDENADSVLARADEAMYENKKSLKNSMNK